MALDISSQKIQSSLVNLSEPSGAVISLDARKTSTILEFPPNEITSTTGTMTITSGTYGTGTYIATVSSIYGGFPAYLAFESSTLYSSTDSFWHSGLTYNAISGNYIGNVSTLAQNGITYMGEWIQIDLPQTIRLTNFSILPRQDWVNGWLNRGPNTFVILGSNDGNSWNLVDSESGITWSQSSKTFSVNTLNNYSKYRLVTSIVGNSGQSQRNSLQISRWKLYGISSSTVSDIPISRISTFEPPQIIQNGLIAHIDPNNVSSYPGTGGNLYNLVDGNTIGTLSGTYNTTSGNIRLVNTHPDMSNNTSRLQLTTLNNITTVSIWMKQESVGATGGVTLLDMRTGASGGWIWSGTTDSDTGTNWTSGTLYKNGGSAQAIRWTNIQNVGNWQNITVIANTPGTDDMTLFANTSIYGNDDGLDVTFGPILIYNRAITQAENESNFNAIRSRYSLDGGLSSYLLERPLSYINNTNYLSLSSSTYSEFPPTNLTAATTIVTNSQYGNGEYVVTRRSENSSASRFAYNVFRGIGNDTDGYYQTATSPAGGLDTTDDGYVAWYITLRSPTPFILKSYLVKTHSSNADRVPTNFRIYGSNNGDTWTLLDRRDSADPTLGKATTYTVNNDTSFFYYKFAHENGSELAQLRYYGYHYNLNTNNSLTSSTTANINIETNRGLTVTALAKIKSIDTLSTDGLYPPAAMTSNTTSLSSQTYGNGTYVAGSSTNTTGSFAFDKNISTGWGSRGGRYDINGIYLGNNEIFPPGPMTADSTTFSGLASANGTYTVSVSSTNSGSAGYLAMDRSTTGSFWESNTGVYNTSGSYIGASSIWSTLGEWIHLSFGVTSQPQTMTITCLDPSRAPSSLRIISSQGISEETLASDWTINPTQTFSIAQTPSGRSYWGFLVPSLSGTGGSIRIDEMSFTQIDPVTTTDTMNTAHRGEWIQLQLPINIYPKSFTLTAGASNNPSQFALLGSNNGSNWDLLYNTSFAVTLSSSGTTFLTNSPNLYNYFRLIVKSVNGSSSCNVYELSFTQSGVPRPPATLIDGSNLTGTQRIHIGQCSHFIHPLDWVDARGVAPIVITETNNESFTTTTGSPTFTWDSNSVSQSISKTSVILLSDGNSAYGGNSTMLIYQFIVPVTTTYNIQLQGLHPNGNNDSFFVSLNGGAAQERAARRASFTIYDAQSSNSYTLSAGTHTLTIQTRERGALGGIIIRSTDGKYYGYSVNANSHLYSAIYNGNAVNPRISSLELKRDIPILPTLTGTLGSPVIAIDSRSLFASNGMTVSQINSFTQSTVSAQPTYNTINSYRNFPYMSFNSNQFLTRTSVVFNVATKGGFTIMILFKPTGTATIWERIFDFGSNVQDTTITLVRQQLSNAFFVELRNSTTVIAFSPDISIQQNEWAILSIRYRTTTNILEVFKNGNLANTTSVSSTMTNRTINCFIGQSPAGGNRANMDCAALYAYDTFLTDSELNTLYNQVSNPTTLSNLQFDRFKRYTIAYNDITNDIKTYINNDLIQTDTAIAVYPPQAMSSNTTNVSSIYMYGNGNYIASASSSLGGTEDSFYAFNKIKQSGDIWTIGDSSYYSAGSYVRSPQTLTTIGGTNYAGEWLQIQLPVSIKLSKYTLFPRIDDTGRSPKDFWIAGSTDGITWVLLDTRTSQTSWTSTNLYTVNSTNYYSYFRIIVNSNNGSVWVSIGEWELFGTEQITNKTLTRITIGRSTLFNNTSSDIDIVDLKVYDRELTQKEIQKISQVTTKPALVISSESNKIEGSDSPYISLDPETLDLQDNTKVTDFNGFIQTNDSQRPVYHKTGGYLNRPYIEFKKSAKQFLTAGRQNSFSINSKGGFTVAGIVRFPNEPTLNERIIELTDNYGTSVENLVISRSNADRNLRIAAFNKPSPADSISAVSTWSSNSTAANNNWWGMCWSPELLLFVAVSNSGSTDRVMTSTDGLNWVIRVTPNIALTNVCWSPQLLLFVAIGMTGTGSRVITSSNGIDWVSRTTPADNTWRGICWSPELSLFVAVSQDGVNQIMTSNDGINWISRPSPENNEWVNVIWSPERRLFVSVAYNGTNRIMTSSDGIIWTARLAPVNNSWYGLSWSSERGMFVSVSRTGSGNRVMTSFDGINWTIRTTPQDNNWTSVSWSPELGLFIAVCYDGINRLMTSSDGINWTLSNASGIQYMWTPSCWAPELGIFASVSIDNRAMISTPTKLGIELSTKNNMIYQNEWVPFAARYNTSDSNITIYKGTSINTTSAVLEYPPSALIGTPGDYGYTVSLSGQNYGNGSYTISNSQYLPLSGLTNIFDKSSSTIGAPMYGGRYDTSSNYLGGATFPPAAMTAASTTFSGLTTANGTYTVAVSSTSGGIVYNTSNFATVSDIQNKNTVTFDVSNREGLGGYLGIDGTYLRLYSNSVNDPILTLTFQPFKGIKILSAGWSGTVSVTAVQSGRNSPGAGNNYSSIQTSSDGITWTERARVNNDTVMAGTVSANVTWTNSTPLTEDLYVRSYITSYSIGGGTNIRLESISFTDNRLNLGYYAMDRNTSGSFWQSQVGIYDTSGSYIGTNSLSSVSGEWITLTNSYTTMVKYVTITCLDPSRAPLTFRMYRDIGPTFTSFTAGNWLTNPTQTFDNGNFSVNAYQGATVWGILATSLSGTGGSLRIDELSFKQVDPITTTDTLGTTYSGEYLQLQLPNQINLKSFSLANTSIRSFALLGSTGGSTWNTLYNTNSDATISTSGTIFTTNSTIPYNYYRLIVKRNTFGSIWSGYSLGEMKLFSSLTDRTFTNALLGKSSGEIYSNLDLSGLWIYDTALSDSNLKELYNSVSTGVSPINEIAKIESNINTSFDLDSAIISLKADNDNLSSNIFEFPPDNKIPGNIIQTTGTLVTQINGTDYGNGTYTFAASTVYNIAGDFFPPTLAFDSTTLRNNTDSFWSSAESGNTIYDATTGTYTSTVTTIAQDGTNYFGEWLQIGLPYPIILSSYSILPRQETFFWRRSPNKFVILGSNDNLTWNLVNSQSGIGNWTSAAKRFTVLNNVVGYQFYRIVISVIGNSNITTSRTSVNISRWRLFGSPSSITQLLYPPSPLTTNSTNITNANYAIGTYTASASSTTTGSAFTPFSSSESLVSGKKSYWESSLSFNSTTGGYSSAATNWVTRTADDFNWLSVCWSPQLSLFAASSWSGRMMSSSDGITWTTRTNVGIQVISVIWVSELALFVGVANTGTGNRAVTSTDGINWTTRSTPVDNSWNAVAWSPELRLLVAVGSTGTGNRVMTSSDGINWKIGSSAGNNIWVDITWSPELSLFAAVANDNSLDGRIMTSPDGITWTIRSAGTGNYNSYGICWSSELSLFVVVSQYTGQVIISSDGINWYVGNYASILPSNVWNKVIWVKELALFVAVANSGTGNRIAVSTNGTVWSSRSSAADNNWKGLTYSPELNMFVAVGDTGTGNRVMTSGGLDFENMISNTYESWIDESPNTTKSMQTSDTDGYPFAFRVDRINDGTGTIYGITQTVNVASHQIGKSIYFTCRYKRRGVTGNNRLESSLQFLNSSDVQVGIYGLVGDTSYNTNDTTWRTFSYQSTAIPIGTAKIIVKVGTKFNEDFDLLPDVRMYTDFTSEYLQLQLPKTISPASFTILPRQIAPFDSVGVYLPFNGNISDASTNNVSTIMVGTQRYTTSSIMGTGALYLANEDNITTNTIASNYLTISYTQSTPLTISCWVLFTKMPTVGSHIFAFTNPAMTIASLEVSALYISSTSASLFSTFNQLQSLPSYTVNINTWYHITFTYIPSTSCSIYINGSLIGSITTNIPASLSSGPPGNANGLVVLGDRRAYGSIRPFAGYIDEFTIYNRTLTESEIAFLATPASLRSPRYFLTLGSTTGTSWDLLYKGDNINWSSAAQEFVVTNPKGIKYNYFRLLTTRVGNSNITGIKTSLQIAGMTFSENNTVPTQNTYSYISLGDTIQTDLTKSPLQINSDSIFEFPPQALTANTTTISTSDYANGIYIASASSSAFGWIPYGAFDNGVSSFLGGRGRIWQTNNYSATMTDIYGISYTGTWLQISLPQKIKLRTYKLSADSANGPKQWVVLGSNDGTNWEPINTHSFLGNWSSTITQSYTTSTESYYSFYRIMILTGFGANPMIAEWKLYGTLSDTNIISFNKIKEQHLTIPQKTLNIAANGGFTLTSKVRLENIGTSPQSIIDLGSSSLAVGNMKLSLTTGGNLRLTTWNTVSSTDSITAVSIWNTQISAADNNWRSICWSPELSLFVAVSENGTGNRVMTSKDGIIWKSGTITDNVWTGICWSPELSLFVAVGINAISTSNDGITWTPKTSPANLTWRTVIWVSELSLFVAVSESISTNSVITSSDGILWTTRTTNTNCWVSLTWSPSLSLLVAVAYTGTGNRIMTSTDGINWVVRSSPADNAWKDVTWSSQLNLFVAVADSGTGNRIMTSSNGINWVTRTSPADNNWHSIVWVNELSLFVAVAYSGTGNRIMTSSDGITWTTRPSAVDNNWLNINWAPQLGIFAAVSISGTGNRVMTSTPVYKGIDITTSSKRSLYLANEANVLATPTRATNYLFAPYTQTGPITVSCWINVSKLPQASNKFSIPWNFVNATQTTQGFGINIGYTSSTQGFINIGYNSVSVSSSTSIFPNIWYHVVGIYIPSTSISLYVNSNLIGSITSNIPSSFNSGPAGAANSFVVLGDHYSSGALTAPFAGYIDNFTIYDRVLSVSEIEYLANNPSLSTPLSSANIHLPFDNLISDASKKGVSTTMVGTIRYGSGVREFPLNEFLTVNTRYTRSDADVALDSRQLTSLFSNSQGVYSWGEFYQQTSTARPTFISSGGYNNLPYVSFNRTTSQFLQLPSITLNIASNGGFTALALVRFTGTAGDYERIFDFGNGISSNNIVFLRNSTTQQIYVSLWNNNVEYVCYAPVGSIVQNSWQLFSFRYTYSTNLVELFTNGTRVASGTSTNTLTNRTLTSNFIGRPNWNQSYSNIDISSLYVFDRALSDAELNKYTTNMLAADFPFKETIELSVNNKIISKSLATAPITNRTVTGTVGKSHSGIYKQFSDIDVSSLYLFDRVLSNAELNTLNDLVSNNTESLTATAKFTQTNNSRIVQVPPISSQRITSGTFTITDSSYGNGTFYVTSSGNGTNREAYQIFDSSADRWGTTIGYDSTTGIQTRNLDPSGTGYLGEWMKIQLPYNLRLTSYRITGNPLNDANRNIRDFGLFGSTDNITWTKLNDIKLSNNPMATEMIYTINTTSSFKYFLYIINRNWGTGATVAQTSSLKFYGIIDQSITNNAVSARYLKLSKPSTTPQLDSPRLEVIDSVGNNVAIDKTVVSNNVLKQYVSPTIASPLASRNYNPIQNGLIAWFDPNDPLCYSGSGATLGSLVGTGISGTIGGTSSFANGTIRLTNTSLTDTSNVSYFKTSTLTGVSTISLWYYQHSAPTNRFLFSNDNLSSFMWNGGNGGSSIVYINGGTSNTVVSNSGYYATSGIENLGKWQNITIITTQFTNPLTLFARYNFIYGLDVTFGPILVYNRAITQAENEYNFNSVLANYFSNPNPTLPITNGLIAWLDPSDSRSYSGTGATLNSLIPTSTSGTGGNLISGTVGGTYTYNATSGTIRLTNNSSSSGSNVSYLQLSSLSNISTVSIWYYQHSTSGSVRYLLDTRLGSTEGYILSQGAGANWTTGSLYKNGGSATSINWFSNLETVGTWQNITVVANIPQSDDMTLFSSYTQSNGLDVTFGPVLVYNRALTETENRINYEIMNRRLLTQSRQTTKPAEFSNMTRRNLMYPPIALYTESISINTTSINYGTGMYSLFASSISSTRSTDGSINVDSRSLNLTNGTSVSSWNGYSQGTLASQPVYSNTSDFNNSPIVSFRNQFMNAGSKTFNFGTNNGLTILFAAKFVDTIGPWNSVFAFFNTLDNGSRFSFLRNDTNTTGWLLETYAIGGPAIYGITIPHNKWNTVGIRYNVVNSTVGNFKISVNNQLVSDTTTGSLLTNQTFNYSYLARGPWVGDPLTNMDLAGLYIYDRALSDAEYSTAYNNLTSFSTVYNAFDGTSGTFWTGARNVYNTTTGAYLGSVITRDILGNSYIGDYLQIKLPESLYLNNISLTPNTTTFATTSPTQLAILGSGNGIDYNLLTDTTSGTWTANSKMISINGTTGSMVPYNDYRIVFENIPSNNSNGNVSISELKLFGGTIQSKNSVKEFPPAPMTSNTTAILNTSYGAGTYIASVSSNLVVNDPAEYNLFSTDNTYGWRSQAIRYNVSGSGEQNGEYIGTTETLLSNSSILSIKGEWFQLQTPNLITLDSLYINGSRHVNIQDRYPRKFYVLGSRNGITWSLLSTHNTTNFNSSRQYYIVNAKESYNYFRVVINSIGSPSATPIYRSIVEIGNVKLFGTETLNPEREFPPGPLSSNSLSLTGYPYSEGTYTLSPTSYYGDNVGWKALDDNYLTNWRSSTLTSAKVMGNNGGDAIETYTSGAGGGGATQVGGGGFSGIAGNGGEGYSTNITGTMVVYGSGGGGGKYGGASGGIGGTNAGSSGNPGTDGIVNTGGGGGGANTGSDGVNIIYGGNGGSGIVVIRYDTSNSNSIIASGGDVVSTIGNFKIHQFTISGANTFTVTQSGICDILIVGGGGGGGNNSDTWRAGGGGGGGKVIHLENYNLLLGSYSITVGSGGNSTPTNGANSSFDTIIALGGGAGGSRWSGASGGSGGGSGRSGSAAGSGGTAIAPSSTLIPGTILANTNSTAGWVSSNAYHTTSGNYLGLTSMTSGNIGYAGEWLQLQMPITIRPTKYVITPTYQNKSFPPQSMTTNSVIITSALYGNGTYVATASSIFGAELDAWRVFNALSWFSAGGKYSGAGAYTGTTTTISVSGIVYSGEWIQLQLPISIGLQSYTINSTGMNMYTPGSWVLLGSNSGSNNSWELLDSKSGYTQNFGNLTTVISNTQFYNYYRVVFLTTNGNDSVAITGLSFNGNIVIKSPSTFYLFGSTDGASYTLLDTETNVNWASYLQTFPVNTVNSYNYFRLLTTVVGNSSSLTRETVEIADLSIYGEEFLSSNYIITDIGTDANIRSIKLINDTASTTASKNLVGSQLSLITSTGTETYIKSLDTQKDSYTLLDTLSKPGYTTIQTPFTQTFSGHNDTRLLFDSSSISMPISLEKTKDNLLFQTGTISTSFSPSITVNNSGGVALGNNGTHITRLFEGTTSIGGGTTGPISIIAPSLDGNLVSPVVSVDTRNLTNFTSGTKVSSIGSFTQGTSIAQPTFSLVTPNQNMPYMSFDRTNSQFIAGSSSVLNIATNGGFTALALARFNGTPSQWERIFDFGNGENNNNIVLHRSGTSGNINFNMRNDSTQYYGGTTTNPIVQGEWAVFGCRYTASTRIAEIFKNGVSISSTTFSSSITNKSNTINYIFKSHWTGESTSNADLASFYAYDRSLSNVEMDTLYKSMITPLTRISIGRTLPTANYTVYTNPEMNTGNETIDYTVTNKTTSTFDVKFRKSDGTSLTNNLSINWKVVPLLQPYLFDQLSSISRNTCNGAYSLFKLNSNYTGPIIQIVRSSDSLIRDFYGDINGNLIDSNGISVINWLSGYNGYISIWYDQSGKGNHATQTIFNFRPIITGTPGNYLVDFQNSSTQFLNIPSGTVPVGTLNAPYTFALKHGTINNTNAGGFLGSGGTTGNQANSIRCAGSENKGYWNYWWGNDLSIGLPGNIVSGNRLVFTYNGTNRTGYINGSIYASAASSGYTVTAGQQYIGRTSVTFQNEFLNGQLNYIFIFNTAIPESDIQIINNQG